MISSEDQRYFSQETFPIRWYTLNFSNITDRLPKFSYYRHSPKIFFGEGMKINYWPEVKLFILFFIAWIWNDFPHEEIYKGTLNHYYVLYIKQLNVIEIWFVGHAHLMKLPFLFFHFDIGRNGTFSNNLSKSIIWEFL